MSRSLKVRENYIDKVRKALIKNSYHTQKSLAQDVGISLSTVNNFLTGKPVDSLNFEELCRRLALDWRDIASFDVDEPSQPIDKNPGIPPIPLIPPIPPNGNGGLIDPPDGPVKLGSQLYLERDSVESLCYEVIVKPGSLIRIKAPKLMGKTSLLFRILAQGQSLNYRTVYLDLSIVQKDKITNLDKFLRWLCLMVGNQLALQNHLNDSWDTETLGSNDNCTVYFEEYLLASIDCPLIFILDNLDRVFLYPEVREDFLGMLRSWYERGQLYKKYKTWKQLRLVLSHSTESYVPMDDNRSPLNIGVAVDLLEFDQKQVLSLARLHQMNWKESEVKELMQMVGGHPYLVRLALYKIGSGKITLEQLLKEAPTEAGIYSNHLRRYLDMLKQTTELAQAFQRVVTSSEPIELNSMQIFKLDSMGLVQKYNNQVMPRCNLYRQYFRRVLSLD